MTCSGARSYSASSTIIEKIRSMSVGSAARIVIWEAKAGRRYRGVRGRAAKPSAVFGDDVRAMLLVPDTLTRPVTRLGAAAQNALEVARFGGLRTDEEASPYEVAAEHRVYKLRHYFPRADGAAPGPPVLLVPPLMLAADVYDVAPSSSAVTILREQGSDPWVVDFGSPDEEEGGLERTLADHVLAVSDAVDRVRELTGRDVHLAGYSQGGMFCYQTAAYRRSDGIDSVVTFGSPVDTRGGMPFGLPERVTSDLADLLADAFRGMALPAWASRTGFRLLDPVKTIRGQAEFILQLHDREALLRRERQRRFLEGDGWVAWPGPAMADFLRQFIAHNRMLEGGFVIEDRLVTLADIRRPILAVVGTVDQIAPAAGVRAIEQAAPAAEVYELALRAGHFGLVVGSLSDPGDVAGGRRLDPLACRGGAECPEGIAPVSEDVSPELAEQVRGRVGYGVELAAGVGAGMARSVLGTATRAADGRPRAGARGGRAAAAAGPARADAAEHADLARAARGGAAPTGARRGVLPVRGPGLHGQGRQRPDRQRRPRADLDRRPPGRARRGADGHAAERARARSSRSAGSARYRCCCARTATWRARPSSGRSSGSSPTPSAPRSRPGSRTWPRTCSAAAAARATWGCR